MRCSPFAGKGCEDAVEDTHAAPSNKAVIQCFVRAIVLRRVAPTKAVADNVDDPRNHPQIVNARDPVRQGKVRFKALQLRPRQPELIVHEMSSLKKSIIISENAEQKINGS